MLKNVCKNEYSRWPIYDDHKIYFKVTGHIQHSVPEHQSLYVTKIH